MKKIILIGCPGSGKSTMSFVLEQMLEYPVLHLDKIYHIDNNTHISREELVKQVDSFATNNDRWIIDGNYISTVEQRINLADTIILLDIDTDICVQNAIDRSKKERGDDMAAGFDNSKLQDGFIDFIKDFKNKSLPKIMALIEKYKNKNIFIFKNYQEINEFLEKINKNSLIK